MKKSFLLLAVLLMFGSAAFAGDGLDLGIGVKAGYQTAKLSYQRDDIKAGFADHFTVGIFGRIGFGRFYIQPEVLYFKTSNTFNVDFTGTGDDNIFHIPTGAAVNMTLNAMNIQVPVLVGFKLVDLGVATIRAQVGPTANFTIKPTTLWSYDTNEGQTGNFDASSLVDTKSIAWGMQVGGGVDILKFITLDINYNFGLSKVFNALNNVVGENKLFDFGNIDQTKQGLFMVTVGLKL